MVLTKVQLTGTTVDLTKDLLANIQVQPNGYVNLDSNSTGIIVTKYIPPPFVEDFDVPYKLAGGSTSPDGVWYCDYTGYGVVETVNGVLHERPMTSTSPTGSDTHASLVTSVNKWTDFILDIDMRTNQQLRQNYPAKNWECAWIMFRYADKTHHYYFVLKNRGYEFGKKDNKPGDTSPEKQIFLATGSTPSVMLGSFQHVKITAVGFRITISVNGNKIVDVLDKPNDPIKMAKGSVGLYNEDADVSFDNLVVQKIE